MPPDQDQPSSEGSARLRAAFAEFRTVIHAELDRLFTLALAQVPEPAAPISYDPRHELPVVSSTPDADALLRVASETGSNTRTETVQQVGRP